MYKNLQTIGVCLIDESSRVANSKLPDKGGLKKKCKQTKSPKRDGNAFYLHKKNSKHPHNYNVSNVISKIMLMTTIFKMCVDDHAKTKGKEVGYISNPTTHSKSMTKKRPLTHVKSSIPQPSAKKRKQVVVKVLNSYDNRKITNVFPC